MARILPIELEGGRGFEVQDPLNGEPLGEYTVADEAAVAAAVARAREVQPAWGAIPVSERAGLMAKALQVLLQIQDSYLERLTAETGRPDHRGQTR